MCGACVLIDKNDLTNFIVLNLACQSILKLSTNDVIQIDLFLLYKLMYCLEKLGIQRAFTLFCFAEKIHSYMENEK